MKRYYVTNVDTEVTVFQKTGKIAVINNSAQAQHTELYIKGKCAYVFGSEARRNALGGRYGRQVTYGKQKAFHIL